MNKELEQKIAQLEGHYWSNGVYRIYETRGEFNPDVWFFWIVRCSDNAVLSVNPDTLEEAEDICRFFTVL